jgi:ubiquitin conjugation factor E4 B
VGYYKNGILFDRLGVNSLATSHLMPTIIRFFIGRSSPAQTLLMTDVEYTGGHTQFFGTSTSSATLTPDKFNFRRDMSKIFKSLWANPLHREAFVKSRQ